MRYIADGFTCVVGDASRPLDDFRFGPPRMVVRTLLDTFDGRLHRAGLRLEVRDSKIEGVQLILSSDGASPVQIRVDAVPHFAAELPHGAIRSRLLAITDVRALLPMVTVGGSAQSGSLHDDTGKIVVRASLGRGLRVVHPKGGPLPPDVLEVHALRGYESYARELRDQFDPTGRSLHPGDALQLAAAMARVDLAGFDTSPSVPLDKTMPALSGTCAVLRDLADTMERTWQGTIDRVDPEFLHDLRVAVRRSRSVLSQSKEIFPTEVFAWSDIYLRKLGKFTGPARDLDVYLIEWDTYTKGLTDEVRADLAPLFSYLREQRDHGQFALVADLSSRTTRRLRKEWMMWLRDATNEPQPPRTSELEGQELGRWVAERIRRSAKKLITQGEAIEPTTEAEQLHDLRKRAKTLRYMVECFASLLVDDARKSFVKRLKVLQDNLGEIQDAAVHAEELQRTLERLGKDGVQKTTLAAGRLLTDSLDARQRSARAAFDDEFNAFNSRPTKRLLDEALSELES